MLKMECPKCKAPIYSRLLAEITTVYCRKCKTHVPVDDVLISASGYTMFRNDILYRISRYEKLLQEAEKEVIFLGKSGEAASESLKSLRKFIANMNELLDGARDHFRAHLPHVDVNYGLENNTCSGKLINLSVAGACIEPENIECLPQVNSDIYLDFSLPSISKPFSLKGNVAWIKKGAKNRDFDIGIGVKFIALNETSRLLLWEFVISQDNIGQL